MTLDEAITHCLEVADGHTKQGKCSECAEDHKQLAEWLTDYKRLKEQESSGDNISRQAAIDAVKKNTFRLTFAEEQGCKGHVAWSAEAVYSDVIERALLELSPVNSQPKTGHWIAHLKGIYAHLVCDRCLSNAPYDCRTNYCPNCGRRMIEPQTESEVG